MSFHSLPQAFVNILNERKPEVERYAQLAVECQSQELLMSVKSEHKALNKQWTQLSQRLRKWGKLLDCCITTWELGLAVQDELRELEQWISECDSPGDNPAMLTQHSNVLVSRLVTGWE